MLSNLGSKASRLVRMVRMTRFFRLVKACEKKSKAEKEKVKLEKVRELEYNSRVKEVKNDIQIFQENKKYSKKQFFYFQGKAQGDWVR